jgi:hypothetical protein
MELAITTAIESLGQQQSSRRTLALDGGTFIRSSRRGQAALAASALSS